MSATDAGRPVRRVTDASTAELLAAARRNESAGALASYRGDAAEFERRTASLAAIYAELDRRADG